MKPYFRKKGRYNDGRNKVVVEFQELGKLKSFVLPKPEKILEVWGNTRKNWHKIKVYIELRDNFKCVKCDSNKNLIIHHKDRNQDNCRFDNLITLCSKCHKRMHKKKEKSDRLKNDEITKENHQKKGQEMVVN